MLGTVSELVASIAHALGGLLVASAMAIAVVHGGAARGDHGALMSSIFVAGQLLTADVVAQEGESWRVVIVRD